MPRNTRSQEPKTLGEALQQLGATGWIVARSSKLPSGAPVWCWWQGPYIGWGTTYDTGQPTTRTAWWPTRAAAEQAVRNVYGRTWRRHQQAVKVTDQIARETRQW